MPSSQEKDPQFPGPTPDIHHQNNILSYTKSRTKEPTKTPSKFTILK